MKSSHILKTLIIGTVTLLSYSCADLDVPSDGRITYKQIFSDYNKIRRFFGSCQGYIPQYGLMYNDNTPLASYCDEAHDAGDNRSGTGVNAWYNNRTSSFNNPLTTTPLP